MNLKEEWKEVIELYDWHNFDLVDCVPGAFYVFKKENLTKKISYGSEEIEKAKKFIKLYEGEV